MVLQGSFVGSVVGLNKDLLEWQVFADERIDPVFVLQHDFLRDMFTEVLHLPDWAAIIAVSSA